MCPGLLSFNCYIQIHSLQQGYETASQSTSKTGSSLYQFRMPGVRMGSETPPAFTALPSEAEGEQVPGAGGPWGHPLICTRNPHQLHWCQLSLRGTGCSLWLCKDTTARGYLAHSESSCGGKKLLSGTSKQHLLQPWQRESRQVQAPKLPPWLPVPLSEFQLFSLSLLGGTMWF